MLGRNPREWRTLSANAIAFAVIASAFNVARIVIPAIILTFGVLGISFIAGYLFRARLTQLGKPARFQFLRVRGDISPEDD